MTYQQFIQSFLLAQNERVKAFSLPKSCATDQIPEAFCRLLPDIVKILSAHADDLADPDEVIAVFGIQPGTVMLHSELPEQLNRIFNHNKPKTHFCCTLDYLTVPESELPTIQSWHNSKTLVVDFTQGLLMDVNQYVYKMFGKGVPGKVYGTLDQERLSQVWHLMHVSRYHPQYT